MLRSHPAFSSYLALAVALFAFGASARAKPTPQESNTDKKIRLVGDALNARDKGDLMGARKAVLELTQIAPNDPTVQRLRAEIESQITAMRTATDQMSAEERARTPGPSAKETVGADGSIPVVIPGSGTPAETHAAPVEVKRVSFFSTRAYVGEDTRSVEVKFVVDGPERRLVLIRGIGPALKSPTLKKGFLAEPLIELVGGGDVVLKENSDWHQSGDPAFIATTVESGGGVPFNGTTRDAAIVTTLDPGNYTVRFRGVRGNTGIGVVEVYQIRP